MSGQILSQKIRYCDGNVLVSTLLATLLDIAMIYESSLRPRLLPGSHACIIQTPEENYMSA